MQPHKLKSGKWNVQVYLGIGADGKKKVRSITKPTRRECLAEAQKYTDKSKGGVMRVEEAVRRYLESRKEVLSPNTYRPYHSMYKKYFDNDGFGFLPIDYLSNRQVQTFVSSVAKSAKPKTVKNVYSLFLSSVRFFGVKTEFNVKLPQPMRPKLHTPTTAEVKAVLAVARERNDELYKAILLGSIGMMRQGEICALTADDIDFTKCTVTINKALALSNDKTYVIKPPKSESSNRTIILPKFVIDQLPREGRIVNMNNNAINMAFHKAVKAAGVEKFRFHDLRHYGASIAASSSVGASVESIKARGGWSTDQMMKRVYINQIGEEVDKDTARLCNYFEQNFKD